MWWWARESRPSLPRRLPLPSVRVRPHCRPAPLFFLAHVHWHSPMPVRQAADNWRQENLCLQDSACQCQWWSPWRTQALTLQAPRGQATFMMPLPFRHHTNGTRARPQLWGTDHSLGCPVSESSESLCLCVYLSHCVMIPLSNSLRCRQPKAAQPPPPGAPTASGPSLGVPQLPEAPSSLTCPVCASRHTTLLALNLHLNACLGTRSGPRPPASSRKK